MCTWGTDRVARSLFPWACFLLHDTCIGYTSTSQSSQTQSEMSSCNHNGASHLQGCAQIKPFSQARLGWATPKLPFLPNVNGLLCRFFWRLSWVMHGHCSSPTMKTRASLLPVCDEGQASLGHVWMVESPVAGSTE